MNATTYSTYLPATNPVVGKLTLKKAAKFTQYSECAAWTDYVKCEPQTVDLKTDGYWVFASFDGVLSQTTFPVDGFRKIGQPWKASVQTQKHGGIGNWIQHPDSLYLVEITNPDYCLKEFGVYGEGCGVMTGKPIIAITRKD